MTSIHPGIKRKDVTGEKQGRRMNSNNSLHSIRTPTAYSPSIRPLQCSAPIQTGQTFTPPLPPLACQNTQNRAHIHKATTDASIDGTTSSSSSLSLTIIRSVSSTTSVSIQCDNVQVCSLSLNLSWLSLANLQCE